MIQLVVFLKFCLATAGASALTRMLVMNTPLDRKPMNCPLCTGFWYGAALQFVVNPSTPWQIIAVHAFAGAAVAWLFYRAVTGEH